jgi:hypothetical protein
VGEFLEKIIPLAWKLSRGQTFASFFYPEAPVSFKSFQCPSSLFYKSHASEKESSQASRKGQVPKESQSACYVRN